MLKNYELLYIIHPDLEGTSDKVMDKVAGFIKKNEGKVLSQEDWGKKKLAYKISKNEFGVYVLVNFTCDSVKVDEIEKSLRLSEEILRSMIVNVPEIKERKKSKKKVEKSLNNEEKLEIEGKAKKLEEKPEKTEKVIEVEEIIEIAKPIEKTDKEVEVLTVEKGKEKTVMGIDRIEAVKKAAKKTEKPQKVEKPEDEKARLKKLDEKLDELLK